MEKLYHKILLSRWAIVLLGLWQFFSILLLSISFWPSWVMYLNLGLVLLYILLAPSFEGLLAAVISIPFYTTIPNPRFDALSAWRVVFAWLFLVWFIRSYLQYRKDKKRKFYAFFSWDKYLGLFLLVCIATLSISYFPVQSLKQTAFLINLYLLYLVVINTVKSRAQIMETIKFVALSLSSIVILGYVQLAATLLTSMDNFWVYWASFISKLYYGQSLASVLMYSNSWFSYAGGGRELRMFSILPDSHAFAVMAAFCIAYLLVLTYKFVPKNSQQQKNEAAARNNGQGWLKKRLYLINNENKIFGISVNYELWSAVRFAGLAVILSGTRAMWVGFLAPFFVSIYFIWKNFLRLMAKKYFWTGVLILLFFALAPLINQSLNYLRVNRFKESFVDRAKTIYDLEDSSNAIRLQMWKNSLTFAAKHPLGVGLGNYLVSLAPAAAVNDFNDLAQARNETFNMPQKYVTAHNLYLNILVEVGIAGLLVFLGFWLDYFRKVWRFIRQYRFDNNFMIFFVVATALTFLWIVAAAVFDVTFFNDRVLMYFFISLGLTGVIMKNYDQLKQ